MKKNKEVKKVIFTVDNYLKELIEAIGIPCKETNIGLEISALLDSEELEEHFSKNSEDFCSNLFSREIGEGCFTFKIVKVTQDEQNEYEDDKEFTKIMEKEYDEEWDD